MTLSSVAIPPPAVPTLPPPNPFSGLPILDEPRGLISPFVAPHQIVPVDSVDPNLVIGNPYVAQLSPTRSTLFVFKISPESGKFCRLVFALPPLDAPGNTTPFTLSSPGGIRVSRLDRPVDGTVSASTASGAEPVGDVPQLLPGSKYMIHNGPCEVDQLVGYRIDSTSGLELEFFQMTSPALGLYVEVA
jgi:glucan endo-1,3-beta-D-glucosidase